MGLQLAACARQPRLVGHGGRREKKRAGDGMGDSEQLVLRKHLLGGRFWSHLAYSAWQGERAIHPGGPERGITEPGMLVE